MAGKQSKLAKNYRKALDAAFAARQKAEDARQAWLGEAAEQRIALLDELAELGEALGGDVQGARQEDGTVLHHGGHDLAFVHGEEGDIVDVLYPGARDVHLVVDPDGQWLLVHDDDGEPLIPDGLHQLLVRALGLPDPDAPADAEAMEAASQGTGRGPSDGDAAHLGRSGTRALKPARDLPPGAVVKDIKGPLG